MQRRKDATSGNGRLMIMLFASLFVVACGANELEPQDQTSKRSSDGRKANGGDSDGGAEGTGGGDANGGEGDAGNDDGSGEAGDGGDEAGGDDVVEGSDEGRLFFDDTVAPMFEAQCVSCHADPRIPVTIRGPVSIYSYDKMIAMLGDGAGPRGNELYERVRNISAHSGGDRCSSDPAATPCKEILAWWDVEFAGTSDPGDADAPVGRITAVTSLGSVQGYAYDPKDTDRAVTVHIYGDGPKGTGTLITSVVADQVGSDGNTPGDHNFTVMLPAEWRNGEQHELYFYVDDSSKPLFNAPRTYTAYSFSDAGRAFYNNNVRNALGGCAGCHTISYEQQFYSLIAPSPAEGGTATDNQLINKPAQTNGVSHGGGVRCNVNQSPCNVIRQWWDIEFGG